MLFCSARMPPASWSPIRPPTGRRSKRSARRRARRSKTSARSAGARSSSRACWRRKSPTSKNPGARRSPSWWAKASTTLPSKACREVETRLLSARSPADLDEAAELLLRGGLVAFPTETVYGLGALALEPLAVRAIYAAKGRPSTNPLIVHVLGEDEARALLERVGAPLAAPSANRAEHVSPTAVGHVLRDLNGRIDAVIDGGRCPVGI